MLIPDITGQSHNLVVEGQGLVTADLSDATQTFGPADGVLDFDAAPGAGPSARLLVCSSARRYSIKSGCAGAWANGSCTSFATLPGSGVLQHSNTNDRES